MQTTPRLTDTQTLRTARSMIERHLPLHANGYKCKSSHLYDVLLGVAASGETIQSRCQHLPGAPKADTVREYLNKQLTLDELTVLQDRLNEALSDKLPQRLRHKDQRIAIDFHDQPYYGKAQQDQAKWIRARARDGTTRFLRVATAYVIHRGLRLSLAIALVMPEDSTVEVLETLLKRLSAVDVPIGCLLLDKGFASIAVMEHLWRHQVPAIMACPIRGKKEPEPTATRALCRGRRSYRTDYTFSNSQCAFTASVAVCRVFTTSRRTGRMPRHGRWLIFIVLGEALAYLSPRQVRRLYKPRFGVETSYRLSHQVRGWTTSSNVAYRFVLMALSFFMVNVWVHLCWLYTQVPRRGGRYLDTERFKLRRYAKFIMQALAQRYGRVCQIVAPAVPRP
ncbi:MAG: ISH3 family transposase [Rhodothermales bacterium]